MAIIIQQKCLCNKCTRQHTNSIKKEKRNKQIPKQSYEEEKNSNSHLHSKLYIPKESFKKQSKLINLAKCFLKKKHIASSSLFPSQICMCQDCMYDLCIIFLYFYSFGEYLISVSQNSSEDVLKIYSIIKYPFFMHALSILSMNFIQQHSDVPWPPFQGFCWSSRVSVHHFSN